MNDRRLRVLLLAEKANPNWISVPFVGWTHVQAIARFADVHLVTHERNRENILARGFSAERVSFVAAGVIERVASRIAQRLEGRGAMGGATQTAFEVPMYYQFELEAWRLMRARLAAGEFDLVHRITPVSPAMPSPFALLCRRLGVPFVIGPLNGGVPWPDGFENVRRREGEWVSYVRAAHKLLPFYRSTRRDAAAILVGSAVAWKEAVASAPASKCFYVPENAVDASRFARTTTAYGERPLPVAFVGRLVPYKGADLLLRAAAPLVRAGRVRLDIIGDGPDRAPLVELAGALGIGAGVRVDGWVPHAELQDRLCASSVFCFPSAREFGGAVVMEAMMLGLVPVVLDYGGPSEVVTEETGVRIALGGGREALVGRLRAALEELVETPAGVLEATGARARRRVLENFSLEAKADKTRAIYEWVRGRGMRPGYLPPGHSLSLYA